MTDHCMELRKTVEGIGWAVTSCYSTTHFICEHDPLKEHAPEDCGCSG